MKKPDYLGESEFVRAIANLKTCFTGASPREADLPYEADASYKNREFGDVPALIRFSTCTNRYRPGPHYQLMLKIRLPGFAVEQLLKIGTADEICAWLENLSVPSATKAFLLELYRDLSPLQRW